MDPAKIQQFAWTNDGFLNGPIRGVILEFPGLGGNGMKGEGPNATELEWGQAGGSAALLYPIVSRHNVVAVAANYPATDLPRTLHHTFGSYGDISEALIAHSPQHQAHRLPDVPYLVIQGDQDTLVDKVRHSDRLVPKMRELGLTVDYREQAGMGHCGPLDWTLHRLWADFVLGHLAETQPWIDLPM